MLVGFGRVEVFDNGILSDYLVRFFYYELDNFRLLSYKIG